MQNDRQITISVGSSRKATFWQAQTLLLSELYEKLRIPARGTETMAEYLGLPKAKQDELKDVGGYVAGALIGTHRKAGAVAGRDQRKDSRTAEHAQRTGWRGAAGNELP